MNSKVMAIFDQTYPKIVELTFTFPEFVPAWKNSLLHLFLYKIQSILESHHQTCHTHFWPCPPKKFSIFKFAWICKKCKNQLIPSVHSWDTINFRVQRPNWLHPYFDIAQPKHFPKLLAFIFISTCKKWGCFIDLFWRNRWFKDLTIWLASSILASISGTGFFTKYRICAENQPIKQTFIIEQIQ